jgi:hypothetical protein
MALMFPRAFRAGFEGERRVYEGLRQALDDRWWVFHDRTIVAHGEEGRIDLILMHRGYGLALLAVVDGEQEIAEEPAREAVREMLLSRGFPQLFGGVPAIVVLAVDPARLEAIGERIRAAFAAAAEAALADPDWVEWVADLLARPDDFETSTATPPAFRAGEPESAAAEDGKSEKPGEMPSFAGRLILGGAVALVLVALAGLALSWNSGRKEMAGAAVARPPIAATAALASPAPADQMPQDDSAAPLAALPPTGDANAAGREQAASPAPPSPAVAHPQAAELPAGEHARALRRQEQRRAQQPWWRRFEPGTPQLNQNNRAN